MASTKPNISETCEQLYKKLNTFVTKVIDRDVQPQIDSLNLKTDDTGWKSITNASGFSTYDSSANPTRYRRIGKIVHIEGIFKNSSALASGSGTVMGTISDTSCRPQYPQYALMQGSNKNFFLLQVRANGQILIERYGTTANAQTESDSWLHCYITYFVE